MNQNYYAYMRPVCDYVEDYEGDEELVEEQIIEFQNNYSGENLKMFVDKHVDILLEDSELLDFLINDLVKAEEIDQTAVPAIKNEDGGKEFIKQIMNGECAFLFSDLGLVQIHAISTFPMFALAIEINPDTLEMIKGTRIYDYDDEDGSYNKSSEIDFN